jgi:hypothetical protein
MSAELGGAATRAAPEIETGECEEQLAEIARGPRGVGLDGRRLASEKAAGDSEARVDIARGHQAVVSDLDEASRQNVQEEATEELVWRQRRGLLATRAEGDTASIERDESSVRETDTMRVPPEVTENLLGPAERGLGVDDPPRAIELVADARESRRIGEQRGWAFEVQLAALAKTHEPCEELPAKESAEHANGKEEVGTGGDPSLAVTREASARHDAMDVGMEPEIAGPRMEHARDPELGAEPS